MLLPKVTPRMEEWDAPSSDSAFHMLAFEPVAVGAAPGKVVKVMHGTIGRAGLPQKAARKIRLPLALRNDVIDLEAGPGRHQAVFAGITRPHLHDHPHLSIGRIVDSSGSQTLQHPLEGGRLE